MPKDKDVALTDSQRNEAASRAAGSRVVSGVGTAVGLGTTDQAGISRAARQQAAGVAAVEAAHAEGVTDPEEIKARKRAAMLAVE